MQFRVLDYGEDVAHVLGMSGNGTRPLGLAEIVCTSPEAKGILAASSAAALFPKARAPEAALSGLYLYLGCLPEAHTIAQEIHTPEGSYWHGIMHRLEPDADNARYWFAQVGRHPVHTPLCERARSFGYDTGSSWSPDHFVDFCESARRRTGSEEETVAKQIQLAEWQLLFEWCARPESEETAV